MREDLDEVGGGHIGSEEKKEVVGEKISEGITGAERGRAEGVFDPEDKHKRDGSEAE